MVHYHIFFRTLILPPRLTGHWKYQVSILFLLQIGLVCRQRQLRFFLHCFRSSHNHCAAYYTSFVWWLCVCLKVSRLTSSKSWCGILSACNALTARCAYVRRGDQHCWCIVQIFWLEALEPPSALPPPPPTTPPPPFNSAITGGGGVGGWIHSAVSLDYVLHAKPQGRDPCWCS